MCSEQGAPAAFLEAGARGGALPEQEGLLQLLAEAKEPLHSGRSGSQEMASCAGGAV